MKKKILEVSAKNHTQPLLRLSAEKKIIKFLLVLLVMKNLTSACA